MRLAEEVVLLLLNEQSGYLEQVAGWNLSCVLAGSVLADLALELRIDTDLESLWLVNSAPLDDDILDAALAAIVADDKRRPTQYWVEKIAENADEMLEQVFNRLQARGILEHSDGGYWSFARKSTAADGQAAENESRATVRQRILDTVLGDDIPDPRDAIIIGLVHSCDAFRFLLETESFVSVGERIEMLTKLDLIGQSVAAAVATTSIRRPVAKATKPVPGVNLRKMLLAPESRLGNSARALARLYHDNGPVFSLKNPLTGKGLIVLAGNDVNIWVNRSARLNLSSKGFIADMETLFGAVRSLTGMDGAEHFRMRKAQRLASNTTRYSERLDEMYTDIRAVLRTWQEGGEYCAMDACSKLMFSQVSKMIGSVDLSDLMPDYMDYKNRAMLTHVEKVLPKFMLKTPRMKAIRRRIDNIYETLKNSHTPAQRQDYPRDAIDDLLSLHESDPQFFPETDIKAGMVFALLPTLYQVNPITFALYSMLYNPDWYRRVRAEAEALFGGEKDPSHEAFSKEAIDVTHRLLLESSRMYPIVPVLLRDVVNSFTMSGYEIPAGTRVIVATTATHYLEENYPDPLEFDIDRYLPGREEHKKPGAYAAFGLGTHICPGQKMVLYQLAVTLLMIAHYFDLEMTPTDYRLEMKFFPVSTPAKSFRFRVKSRQAALGTVGNAA